MVIESIEGSQGPYPLRGPNGERFIIILANSEKVFLDGRKLERGFDKDYVIDYNLAQITFNPKILITQFSVLRADFEYAEQFYSRFSTAVAQELKNEKTSIRLNYYSEKDNNSNTFGFQPSTSDLIELRALGDVDGFTQISGIDSVEFSFDQILYERKDTIDADGNQIEIYLNSVDPNSAFFRVSFSEVGLGFGDYVLKETSSNGRIFQWVSPQGGTRQGNYSPVRQIPLPIQKQMLVIGISREIGKHETISQELAISNIDKNLYSDLDDQDNQGIAWAGNLRSVGRIFKNKEFTSSLSWELDQAEFSPIDRYRPILFDRDWDYTPDKNQNRDFFVTLDASLKNKDQLITYKGTKRNRLNVLNGWQHTARLNQKLGAFYFKSDHFLLKNSTSDLISNWVRTSNDLSFRKGRLIPGYRFSLDQNKLKRGNNIISSRMDFISNQLYLVTSDSSNVRLDFSFENRLDRTPLKGQIKDFTLSNNYRLNFEQSFSNQNIEMGGTFRQLKDIQSGRRDQWLNAQLVWSGKFFRKNLTHRMTYQIGNVRELKREFIYVLVGGNQGTHTWRDVNEDGVQDLNEFYEAINPDERQYAKFFVPTDEFITAFENRYQHSISGRFPKEWKSQGGVRRFIEKWQGQVNFTTRLKTTFNDFWSRVNPVIHTFLSEDIIFANSSRRYNLHFNRYGQGIGFELNRQFFDRKQLLTGGFELNNRFKNQSTIMWRFGLSHTLQVVLSDETFRNQSDFLIDRNVQIKGRGIRPEFIWQPSSNLRIKGNYEYRVRKVQELPEQSSINELGAKVNWNRKGKISIQGELRLIQIAVKGKPDSYRSYQLLEALNHGENITWKLNWQQNLGRGRHMNIQYNGRSSEGQASIHTGTILVTASFNQ